MNEPYHTYFQRYAAAAAAYFSNPEIGRACDVLGIGHREYADRFIAQYWTSSSVDFTDISELQRKAFEDAWMSKLYPAQRERARKRGQAT